ncbi:hypothetical protein PsAD2_01118 [Pseudovibrio axinellae]|uniref:Uncharacterized protein n=1 Tax=Pseudovibrio axinellae TaxID=989403 RepID=A0A166A522_9HYPH|nr:hypothetical protein PsAD2_01118 [Pseudovibrio axinellae]SER27357.1 hypothetical protein SAMN05421798_107259 [Pseudovibrio axinellae]
MVSDLVSRIQLNRAVMATLTLGNTLVELLIAIFCPMLEEHLA